VANDNVTPKYLLERVAITKTLKIKDPEYSQ